MYGTNEIDNLYKKEIDKNGKEIYKEVFWRDITLRGYSMEKLLEILNCLEVERIYDMQLTMQNLSQWKEILENS